ncbi:MAG: molybdopterin molybdotransferase MoeA [Clostridiales Family XIII bacterium]|jgi:molybdopterin molybdotransferase|nr:molybdopterin molybdotransferase MoeA [Clostridiales Family XIII bacterium]
MRKIVSVGEARELLLALPIYNKTERVPLTDALDRIAARDFFALLPYPPFTRSPFDGYAFRSADTFSASEEHPAVLEINQEIPCGVMPVSPVSNGYAAKILTGAPVPEGADVILKFEDTLFSDKDVRIFAPQKPNTNIIKTGEDFSVGTLLVKGGTVITPAVLGIFASQGIAEIEVFTRPVVSIINTGTELIKPGKPVEPAKIYNNSMYTLQGYLRDFGADFLDGGIVEDDIAKINAAIEATFDASDMIVTTGGASVGDYDCALRAAEQAGGDILFWKTDMKPGGSMLAYTLRGKLVLALSGSPGAAALGLLYIALPYIRKLCGRADVISEVCTVRLKNDYKKDSPKLRLIRGYLSIEVGNAYFIENKSQGSGDISSLSRCDLLAEIPAGSPPLAAGALVRAYRI